MNKKYVSLMITQSAAFALLVGCNEEMSPVAGAPNITPAISDGSQLETIKRSNSAQQKPIDLGSTETTVVDASSGIGEEYSLALENRNVRPEQEERIGESVMDMWRLEAMEPNENALEKDYAAIGRKQMQEHAFQDAIQSYQNAIYISDTAENWANLGTAYLKIGEIGRAEKYLEYALEGDGSLAAHRTILLEHYIKQEKPNQALYHASRMMRRSQNDERSQYLIGRAFMKNAMWNEAADAFQQVLTLSPDHIWAANNAAFCALQTGDHSLVVSLLEPFAESEKMTPLMYNNLGVAYERAKRPIDAALAFRKALNDRPAYVKAKINIARVWASLSQEQRDEAQAVVVHSNNNQSSSLSPALQP